MINPRPEINAQIARIIDAASERVRANTVESCDSAVLQLLNRIGEGTRVFGERARYIDTLVEDAQRLEDSKRLPELSTMYDEFARDLQQFKFLAETALEFLVSKVSD
jgi:hypothetical protein